MLPHFELQWGHGGEAVEMITGGGQPASDSRLQWGHGGEAVEMVELLRLLMFLVVLQWGHGGEAVEISPVYVLCQIFLSFNGATAVRPWK
jgi:hypothetical protein